MQQLQELPQPLPQHIINKYTKHYNRPGINKRRKTKKGGAWLFTSSTPNSTSNQTNKSEINIYTSDNISLQSIPSNYKAIGILHITESSAINIIRDIGTGFVNMFGSKGFDNSVYDALRKNTFDKVNSILTGDQKVFNLKFDVETNTQGTTIFIHLYGDLCEQKKDDENNIPK